MTAPTLYLDYDGALHPADVLWREGQGPVLAEREMASIPISWKAASRAGAEWKSAHITR